MGQVKSIIDKSLEPIIEEHEIEEIEEMSFDFEDLIELEFYSESIVMINKVYILWRVDKDRKGYITYDDLINFGNWASMIFMETVPQFFAQTVEYNCLVEFIADLRSNQIPQIIDWVVNGMKEGFVSEHDDMVPVECIRTLNVLFDVTSNTGCTEQQLVELLHMHGENNAFMPLNDEDLDDFVHTSSLEWFVEQWINGILAGSQNIFPPSRDSVDNSIAQALSTVPSSTAFHNDTLLSDESSWRDSVDFVDLLPQSQVDLILEETFEVLPECESDIELTASPVSIVNLSTD
ncbi:hypothetical protein PCE1_004673 [Barthelona sp. PCE]